MTLKEKILAVAKILKKTYPDADCELIFSNTLQLLVAVILSAQCTDKRVNVVTPALFKKYKTVQDFANSELSELENFIKSTGFYRNKAKNIKACCQQILSEYGGKVPESMEKLVKLPGVGRKTAHVVRMHGFNLPGLSVDTHFQRLSKRLGLTKQTDPVKIEKEIADLLPEKEWTKFSSGLIFHGRRCCSARKPACDRCPLAYLCPSAFKL